MVLNPNLVADVAQGYFARNYEDGFVEPVHASAIMNALKQPVRLADADDLRAWVNSPPRRDPRQLNEADARVLKRVKEDVAASGFTPMARITTPKIAAVILAIDELSKR
jgi:hypothetical protein